MKHLTSAILFVCFFIPVIAQIDTTFFYFDKESAPAQKDSAHYYTKVYQKDKLWYRADHWAKTNGLRMEGTYLDKEMKMEEGAFTWYTEEGVKNYTSLYAKGELKEKTFYYQNGSRKSYMNEEKQTGWDSTGKEIPGYIVEKEATFPGGQKGWIAYLTKNLNANIAADAGAPAGNYTVKVQFIIDKEGHVSRARATDIPAKCKPCASEAVRVIANGPDWIPATQNNKRVIYQAIQHITFQVIEEERKRGNYFTRPRRS